MTLSRAMSTPPGGSALIDIGDDAADELLGHGEEPASWSSMNDRRVTLVGSGVNVWRRNRHGRRIWPRDLA